jgi:hypothetical protein
MKHRMLPVLLVAASVAVLTPGYCWAYVDPNTVGFMSQFLAPLATLVVSCLIYFRRKLSAGITLGWRWLTNRKPEPSCDETNS